MKLIYNATIETLDAANPQADCLVFENETLVFVGAQRDMPPLAITQKIDAEGKLITPAFIDPHTHLVYGGNRAREFKMRLEGATYEEIARAGGGIRSTVKATREASDEALFASALSRAKHLLREGVTTLEIKSGYGLSLHDERRQLQTARAVGKALNIDVKTTYLAAHALPVEYQDADNYIDATNMWMKQLASEGLIDAVDAFCEGIGFNLSQTRRVFETAKSLGLPVKLHAEQLSDLSGAGLAADYHALSCDHLEYLSEESILKMKAAGTVAVLLPGAFYFIREKQLPPLALLREHNVPIALATDHNPGSSPCLSPLLIMNMAATLFRMTPQECLKGFTLNAAKALGYTDRGMLKAGMLANFTLWDCETASELTYNFGKNPLLSTYFRGKYYDL